MDRGLAIVVTTLVAGVLALQAPVNSLLGRSVGTVQAAFVSFAVGTAALLVLVLFVNGGMGALAGVRGVPWYHLVGGLMGALYVTCAVVLVRTLGVTGVTAATIAGQLAMAVVVDHFGWLGVDRQPISAVRLVGLALLAVGVYLVIRD